MTVTPWALDLIQAHRLLPWAPACRWQLMGLITLREGMRQLLVVKRLGLYLEPSRLLALPLQRTLPEALRLCLPLPIGPSVLAGLPEAPPHLSSCRCSPHTSQGEDQIPEFHSQGPEEFGPWTPSRLVLHRSPVLQPH